MKPEEAIKILEGEMDPRSTTTLASWEDAVKLGIEALQERQLAQAGGVYNLDLPLPSETVD